MTAKTRLVLTSAGLAFFAVGCASNVSLPPPTIPVPLMDKIPLTVGLRMPENFYSFVHQEQVYGKDEWSIDLGRSNAAFFTQLFGFMFDEVKVLGETDEPAALDLDALIEPSIDAFEFSAPSQSRTDSFAVWVRYRIRVFDRAGTEVANWPISAYGKSSTESMSNTQSLQRAAVLAMRDAAALMIMKLDDETGLSALGISGNKPAATQAEDQGAVAAPAGAETSITAEEEVTDDAG